MCLAAVAWRVHPAFRWVIAANRDEFYARPTEPASAWADLPGVFGGRDIESMGSWLAADQRGHFALVTNIRRPGPASGYSRGGLVHRAMRSRHPAALLARRIAADASNYRPFNLLISDANELHYVHAPSGRAQALDAGVHGVSNGALEPPWPKTRRLRSALEDWCARAATDAAPLLEALADRSAASDQSLPDTGVGLERERFLSAAFLASAHYGTRASTVVTLSMDGCVDLIERSFGPHGETLGERRLQWLTGN